MTNGALCVIRVGMTSMPMSFADNSDFLEDGLSDMAYFGRNLAFTGCSLWAAGKGAFEGKSSTYWLQPACKG